MITPSLKRRLSVSCAAVVLASGAGSLAYAATGDQEDRALKSAVSAELKMDPTSSQWSAAGRFILKAQDKEVTDFNLQFDVTKGTFRNNRPDIVESKQEGRHVTLTPKAGTVIPTWATELSFNISGDGSDSEVPKVESCSIDGTDVGGCSSASAADTESPTAPADNRSFVISHDTVHVMWTKSTDNVGVDKYEIHQDDELVKTVGSNVLMTNIEGLEADTTYKFKVRALDKAGNASPFSPDIELRTKSEEAKPEGPVIVKPEAGSDQPERVKFEGKADYAGGVRQVKL
ncbi:fibronectin type III domain-containing protein, partial [Streptomyces sp. x-80]|uniref:fibronectin type III domain-containing protein n=1 Tax=Streptomyces sp. x-80 TaxID=2789282 RepID=UPI00398030EC